MPEFFATQHGRFRNHYNGEFASWLDLKENETETASDSAVECRVVDVFDLGNYSIAVCNLRNSIWFSIVRINKNLEVVTIYDNFNEKPIFWLEYLGRYRYKQGYVLVASGFDVPSPEKKNAAEVTRLYYVGTNGICTIMKEWPIGISHSNSIAALSDYVYFGQNKMITRLDVITGEKVFYTNKEPLEIKDLQAIR